MIKADNMQRIRANAFARNQAFQAEKRAKAVDRFQLGDMDRIQVQVELVDLVQVQLVKECQVILQGQRGTR